MTDLPCKTFPDAERSGNHSPKPPQLHPRSLPPSEQLFPHIESVEEPIGGPTDVGMGAVVVRAGPRPAGSFIDRTGRWLALHSDEIIRVGRHARMAGRRRHAWRQCPRLSTPMERLERRLPIGPRVASRLEHLGHDGTGFLTGLVRAHERRALERIRQFSDRFFGLAPFFARALLPAAAASRLLAKIVVATQIVSHGVKRSGRLRRGIGGRQRGSALQQIQTSSTTDASSQRWLRRYADIEVGDIKGN